MFTYPPAPTPTGPLPTSPYAPTAPDVVASAPTSTGTPRTENSPTGRKTSPSRGFVITPPPAPCDPNSKSPCPLQPDFESHSRMPPAKPCALPFFACAPKNPNPPPPHTVGVSPCSSRIP